MKIFVAASYSGKVDYNTGQVFDEYREWMESNLQLLEACGFEVYCALREDGYVINDADPAGALRGDAEEIRNTDVFLAILEADISAGVQLEIGMAMAWEKKILLAHREEDALPWFNGALVQSGQAVEVSIPLDADQIRAILTPSTPVQ